MIKTMTLLLAGCLLGCAGCSSIPQRDAEFLPDQPQQQARLVTASNALTGALLPMLGAKDENVLFSPISLTAAFGLAHPGAKGQTATEMEQLFGFSDAAVTGSLMADLQSDNELAKLTLVNAAWITDRYPVRQSYLDTIDDAMQAGIQVVDFVQSDSAAKTINDWIADKTNQRIQNLISPSVLTKKTSMILTNAVWFKAKWQSLEIFGTQKRPFYRSADEPQQADMMEFKKSRHRYLETPLYQAVDLDYKGGQFALSIVLPKARNGLADVEAKLGADGLAHVALELEQSEQRPVSLEMPRITMENNYQLIPELKSLGLEHAFDKSLADFTKIFNTKGHYIAEVVQKTYLTIDEEGTEASSATGIRFETFSSPGGLVRFNVNHPYLLTIRHRPTGAIVFAGRIANID